MVICEYQNDFKMMLSGNVLRYIDIYFDVFDCCGIRDLNPFLEVAAQTPTLDVDFIQPDFIPLKVKRFVEVDFLGHTRLEVDIESTVRQSYFRGRVEHKVVRFSDCNRENLRYVCLFPSRCIQGAIKVIQLAKNVKIVFCPHFFDIETL